MEVWMDIEVHSIGRCR